MFIPSQNWTREYPGQPPSHSRAGWDNSEPRDQGEEPHRGHHWEGVKVRGGYEGGVGAHFVVPWRGKGHEEQDRGEMVWSGGMGMRFMQEWSLTNEKILRLAQASYGWWYRELKKDRVKDLQGRCILAATLRLAWNERERVVFLRSQLKRKEEIKEGGRENKEGPLNTWA